MENAQISKRGVTLMVMHALLILLSIPYALLSWLFGIVPHVYDDPIYRINLVAIAAYDLSAIIAMIITMKYRGRYPCALYVPFIFFAISSAAFVYFIVQY